MYENNEQEVEATIDDLIDDVESLRGSRVVIFGQEVQLDSEIDELDIDIVDVLESFKEHEMSEFVVLEYNEEEDENEEVWLDSKEEYLDNLYDQGALKEINHSNSYNWNAPVSNHFDFIHYENVELDKHIVEFKVHKYGDVRANYTDLVLLEFDTETEFLDKLFENNKTIEYEGYEIEVDITNDEKSVFKDGKHVYDSYETSFKDITKDLDEYFGIEKSNTKVKQAQPVFER